MLLLKENGTTKSKTISIGCRRLESEGKSIERILQDINFFFGSLNPLDWNLTELSLEEISMQRKSKVLSHNSDRVCEGRVLRSESCNEFENVRELFERDFMAILFRLNLSGNGLSHLPIQVEV